MTRSEKNAKTELEKETLPNIVIGILGAELDNTNSPRRLGKWRPTVDLCRYSDFKVQRLELIFQSEFRKLALEVQQVIAQESTGTEVKLHELSVANPWELEEVYQLLDDFSRTYPFKVEKENYFVHISTGTHITQISLFLLTESRRFPAKLIQSIPPEDKASGAAGCYQIIDLNLQNYDKLRVRFQQETHTDIQRLKWGISTLNASFNATIEELERVAIRTVYPILLTGPTGSGKSQLAKRIYELKKQKNRVTGELVSVNCGTLRGDMAMSTLFGHVSGAFTGAIKQRSGLLKAADQGILFLDEIGELGLDEQAMLLEALEEKRFRLLGSNESIKSDFQLIAGTNRNLQQAVTEKQFRLDLLSRINLWVFHLPELRQRTEDLEPNLEFELERVSCALGVKLRMTEEARRQFLEFAISKAATWPGNFRDFNAVIVRMGTLAQEGIISIERVQTEIQRLRRLWTEDEVSDKSVDLIASLLTQEQLETMDLFDRNQLGAVINICRQCKSLAEAGRKLYGVSRQQKTQTNDSDRLSKYLRKYGLDWNKIMGL
ncbi:RNA repair transcriptional activator RtcR [Deltaproteobacteria bacterium TL4]